MYTYIFNPTTHVQGALVVICCDLTEVTKVLNELEDMSSASDGEPTFLGERFFVGPSARTTGLYTKTTT